MCGQNISTVPRFLYLNTYAFLLFFMGIGIVLIPLYRVSWWLAALQIIVFFVCERNAVRIFASWKDKKRKYHILMERNASALRPESFKEYMQAPCGRLLVRIVLDDLGSKDEYSTLMKLRQPLWTNLKSGCRPQETVVYINEQKS